MRSALLATCCLLSFNATANVLQYFTGISYSNPAELFKEKNNVALFGGTYMYGNIKFEGTVLDLNNFTYQGGVNHSKKSLVLPFGRIATRVDKRLVFGVDVTEPYTSNLVWGGRPFTRYASTETLMTDVDISPRFSYSINPKLYAGAGLNVNFLKNNEVNWALPLNETEFTTMINRSSSLGLGYNTGFYYVINPKNFFGATYYSYIKQNTRGESAFGTNVSTNLRFDFHMPATSVFNYVHIFSPKWLISAFAFRSEWNANQFAKVRNTAAPAPFPSDFIFTMNYKASWAFSGVIHHQWTEKTGLSLIGLLDNGPERDKLRTINFPSDTQYFIALDADYHVSQSTTIEMLYGQGFSDTMFYNRIALGNQNLPFTTGRVSISAPVVELRIKVQK